MLGYAGDAAGRGLEVLIGRVPVAAVAIGAARDAGLLAARTLAVADPELRRAVVEAQAALADAARAKDAAVRGAP